MASNTFGTARRPAGKKFRDGLVGDALDDLYSDIDDAFNTSEQTGATQRANLHMDAIPSTSNTIAIGADTYEFLGAGDSISDDTFIGVLIGASVILSLVNLQLAINGAGTGIADGLLAAGVATAVLLENGSLTTVQAAAPTANDMTVICIDTQGNETQGLPAANIALSESLTDAADGFNMVALAAAATTVTGSRTAVVGPITYNAQTEFGGQLNWEIVLPFLPRAHMASAQVSGTGVEIAPAGIIVTYSVVNGENIARIDVTTLVAGAGTANGSEDVTVVFYE